MRQISRVKVKYILIAVCIIIIPLLIQIYIFRRVGEEASEKYIRSAPPDDGMSYYERFAQSLRDSGLTCENYKEKCRTTINRLHGKDKELVIESCRKKIQASLNCE